MDNSNDRFGVTEKAISDEIARHRGVFRSGMYIPTRREVAEMPVERLKTVLIEWMWESPAGLIPKNRQISEVREVLLSRKDDTSSLVAECDEYLRIPDGLSGDIENTDSEKSEKTRDSD